VFLIVDWQIFRVLPPDMKDTEFAGPFEKASKWGFFFGNDWYKILVVIEIICFFLGNDSVVMIMVPVSDAFQIVSVHWWVFSQSRLLD